MLPQGFDLVILLFEGAQASCGSIDSITARTEPFGRGSYARVIVT